jgi:hypothetical protein
MDSEIALHAALSHLIKSDPLRMRLLRAVANLGLPDCWIGAGFVRSAVWDDLHGRAPCPSWDDIDVILFDRDTATCDFEISVDESLRLVEPGFKWSAKNQARMHVRNGDEPYVSTADAVSRWPETATAVCVRLHKGVVETMAPLGLDDLYSLRIRPPVPLSAKGCVNFRNRVTEKRWLERWPKLVVVDSRG